MADVGSSDRNFYDRWYFNAHDRTGDIFAIFGAGYYPNLGTKDAFVMVRRGDEQTAVHLRDAMDHDRLNPHVGDFRIEVARAAGGGPGRPRGDRGHRHGPALARARSRRIQEAPHVMRTGTRGDLDAQRFAQCGSWEGTISIDGEDDRRRRPTAGSAPATGRGASARSARPSRPGARPTRPWAACGGSTCRSPSTTSRSA